MKYAVDRVEKNIVVLQHLKTKEIKEINKKELDFKVNDSDILIYKDDKYYKDEKSKEDRLNALKEKLNRVKNI